MQNSTSESLLFFERDYVRILGRMEIGVLGAFYKFIVGTVNEATCRRDN